MIKRRSFITGISSTKLSSKEKLFLKRYKPWGVILFTRNIKSIDQTLRLTTSIRKIFNDDKYPILIDQEGGRVNRLKNIISFICKIWCKSINAWDDGYNFKPWFK